MQGQPQHVGLLAVNRAFSRFAHVTGYACLCGAILEVIGYQADAPSALIWPVLLLLATTLALLVFLDRWRTGPYSLLFLIVGGVSQYWLSVSLLAAFPSVRMSHTLILSLVSVSLVLVCGPGFVPSSTIIWGTVGFAIGQVASLAAAFSTGSPFRVDAIAIVVEVGLVLVELTDAVTRGRRLAVRPELDRAVIDDELSVLRYRTEVRAAALMHDTVLGHLSAIAAGSDGALQPRLRSEIEKDLAVLIGEEWLNDPTPAPDDPSRSDWRRSALLSAVQEVRDLSLTVDVTGDPGAIGRLTAERDVAVGLAAKQCLVNVLRHAQVDHAEVVVIGSRTDVSIMVIDAGRGFSEQLVASDRLGLRQSVRRRIENVGGEVQLWSTPGRGTSVLIRVPAESAVGSSDE
ncbi:MAG TPA: ATP-binding protein [Galbitalea sp.]|jgi:signal transduction histidine kinase|nr:ATP-binding protein [Galbitalea sp.]